MLVEDVKSRCVDCVKKIAFVYLGQPSDCTIRKKTEVVREFLFHHIDELCSYNFPWDKFFVFPWTQCLNFIQGFAVAGCYYVQ